jgi:hypothetical protein
VAVADVNADGKLDIITANLIGESVGVLLGKGDGTFEAVSIISTGSHTSPQCVVVADVNADGYPDVMTANSYYGSNAGPSVGVLLGRGNGTFAAAASNPASTTDSPNGLAVADVNADGRLDLLTANHYIDAAGVLLGAGDGTFPVPTFSFLSGGQPPQNIVVADMDLDGHPDLVTTNYASTVSVLLGKGDGTFRSLSAVPTSPTSTPYGLAVADMNADGWPDIVVADPVTNAAGLLLGRGDGTCAPILTYSLGAGSNPMGVAVADVNADGQPDILTANFTSNSVGVLLNVTRLAAPTIAAVTPAASAVGTTLTLTGTQLLSTKAVHFNALAAISYTVNSATQLTVVVPAGATTGVVTITTSTGTSSGIPFTVTTALATPAALFAAGVSGYPNPATSTFTVLVPATTCPRPMQATLFNGLGQQLAQQTTTGTSCCFQTATLARGLYSVLVQVGNEQVIRFFTVY